MTKILVIEDEQDILDNVSELLRLEQYTVFTADNGKEGVYAALEHKPDLILSDIKMPQLDGYGVLLELRNNPQSSLIPFIFLTAKADDVSRRQGMELGADDYLTKPFEPIDLINAVKVRLEKHQNFLREREEKLNKLRHNIVQAIPHELRTPLTGILGCAEYLLEMDDLPSDRVHDTADIIMRSGLRLQRIIENFVLYSQLEVAFSDEQRINMMREQSIDYPDALIRMVVDNIASNAERTDDCEVNTEPASIKISHDNFQKLISEIVANAINFSTPGKPITVTAGVVEARYIVIISDEGRGMKREEINNIAAYNQFNREFYEQQGLGLGLIIAKRLTEIHGGMFTIDSDVDAGTTVTISLPLA